MKAINVETLGANKTLTVKDAPIQQLDPAGARDVTLPNVINKGLSFEICNFANAAETITVKDAEASTVETVDQNEAVTFISDGTNWQHTGVRTLALT